MLAYGRVHKKFTYHNYGKVYLSLLDYLLTYLLCLLACCFACFLTYLLKVTVLSLINSVGAQV